MSTNSECEIIEWEEGKWYYVLEHYHAPKNAWDWRENADAYGPFLTEEKTLEHLQNNHANPGGSSTLKKEWIKGHTDEVLTNLIKNAERPRKRFY